MVPDEKSNVMQVGAAPAESQTLLPQRGIATLGVGLLALPFLQAIGVNCLVILASALGGGGRSQLVYSSEHRCDGTRTPLVIAAPIVSPELEDISMVPVTRPSDRQI
jgi:hypothetical protein